MVAADRYEDYYCSFVQRIVMIAYLEFATVWASRALFILG